MKRQWWLTGLVLALALAIGQPGVMAAKQVTPPANDSEDLYKELDLFEHALSIVRSDYVEQPQAKQLIYGALKGMLSTLDPYSQFMDPDSYNELKVETEGAFGGLGIEITLKDELLTVISPIDDTPAYKAGLRPNDRIVKIDGEITRGITLMDAVKKLRGKPGTKVSLTLLREGEHELKEVSLERAIIKVQSVREASILKDKIGYVRLTDFRERSGEDLEAALKGLKDQGVEGLILDLRNNPGGLLDVSVAVAELFLNRHELVVSTKGRLRNQNQELHTQADGIVKDVPLVVMINEGSASASEIVAGAIQDHHRGVVLGTKSHGKASVQTIFPLKDGSALRLTTSKYFTPAGRMIHGQGIIPDVEVPLERPSEDAKDKGKSDNVKGDHSGTDQADEIFDQVESGQKTLKDKEKEKESSSSKKPIMDNQLARAIDLLKGLRVYQSKEKLHASN